MGGTVGLEVRTSGGLLVAGIWVGTWGTAVDGTTVASPVFTSPGVAVSVSVKVGVKVFEAVAVDVGVGVKLGVEVFEAVAVAVGVGVLLGSGRQVARTPRLT